MSNKKTSIPGWLMLIGSIAYLAAKFILGTAGPEDMAAVLSALGGIGLINSQDGSM